MNRRLIPEIIDWQRMRDSFKWDVPVHFNIADACCDSWAALHPRKTAIIHVSNDGAVTNWTYGQLKDASDKLAISLSEQDVQKGDRVAVLLAQSAEVMITHFAAMKLGAIVLPLFTLFGEDALAYRLSDSGARVVVTDTENFGKISTLRPRLPALDAVYLTDGANDGALSFWAEIEAADGAFVRENTGSEDPAVMIYTSGTTGPPKGVVHAHRFLIGHLPSIECSHQGFPQPGDLGWTPADWAWIGGLMDMAMPCLYYGVPLLSHRMRKFDATFAYELLAEHKVRNLFVPPTGLKLMRHTPVPDGIDIRTISSGGESLGADLLQWGRQALGVSINEIYGQTECNLVLATCGGAMKAPPGSMGQPVPGFDVAIIDPDGKEMPFGELGEIAVKAPNPVMFLGYWNKPDKTDEKYVNGWLRTGDMGICDSDGYFTFISRSDDVITSAGYRIGPTEIEMCLTGHPDVVMAAAIGVPDDARTEVVKAFVVLREGAKWEGLEAVLIERVKTKISPHVAPRSVERLSELPMTATGKIMRRTLRAEHVSAR